MANMFYFFGAVFTLGNNGYANKAGVTSHVQCLAAFKIKGNFLYEQITLQ